MTSFPVIKTVGANKYFFCKDTLFISDAHVGSFYVPTRVMLNLSEHGGQRVSARDPSMSSG